MGVNCNVVHKNGKESYWKENGCFGYAYSKAGFSANFGQGFEITDVKYIQFKPKKHSGLSDENALKYLKLLEDIGVFTRISLVNPESELGLMSVFTEGARADITELSGPEWVGLFELLRNCQYCAEYVNWVVLLREKHKFTIGGAMHAPRILNLPQVSYFNGLGNKYHVIDVNNCDTTPNVYDKNLTNRIERVIRKNSRASMYKPYAEAGNFEGVFHFFSGYYYDQSDALEFRKRLLLRNGLTRAIDASYDLFKYYTDDTQSVHYPEEREEHVRSFVHNIYKEQSQFSSEKEVVQFCHSLNIR